MGYRPPKGVSPPHLDGKRTGRPKGSRNNAAAWADVVWGYEHADDDWGTPPNRNALLWWYFAHMFPDELEHFLDASGFL